MVSIYFLFLFIFFFLFFFFFAISLYYMLDQVFFFFLIVKGTPILYSYHYIQPNMFKYLHV